MAESYFPAVRKLAEKFIKLDQRVLINTIVKNQPEIQRLMIELNTRGRTSSQLFELNVNSDGIALSSIGGDYSAFTIEESKKPGKTPKKSQSSINLFDEGTYYESKRITFDDIAADYFNMTSDPITADGTNLEDDWGDRLDGLIISNWAIVVPEIEKHIVPLMLKMAL